MNDSVVVTGAKGRLGSYLVEKYGYKPLDIDITNRPALERALAEVQPRVVVNCAAFTDVDAAQSDRAENKVVAINTKAPGYLRTAFDGYLIHLSTSFVFSGKKQCRNERSVPSPVNFYGISKLGGECAARLREPTLVVRTEQLYGWRGKNFVTSVVERLARGQDIDLPSEVIRTPTYIPHLAEAIAAVIALDVNTRLTGILHLAGKDAVSMLDWAKVIQQVWSLHDGRISKGPGRAGEAPRPRLGGLSVKYAKDIGLPLYGLREGLTAYFNAGDWHDA